MHELPEMGKLTHISYELAFTESPKKLLFIFVIQTDGIVAGYAKIYSKL